MGQSGTSSILLARGAGVIVIGVVDVVARVEVVGLVGVQACLTAGHHCRWTLRGHWRYGGDARGASGRASGRDVREPRRKDLSVGRRMGIRGLYVAVGMHVGLAMEVGHVEGLRVRGMDVVLLGGIVHGRDCRGRGGGYGAVGSIVHELGSGDA